MLSPEHTPVSTMLSDDWCSKMYARSFSSDAVWIARGRVDVYTTRGRCVSTGEAPAASAGADGGVVGSAAAAAASAAVAAVRFVSARAGLVGAAGGVAGWLAGAAMARSRSWLSLRAVYSSTLCAMKCERRDANRFPCWSRLAAIATVYGMLYS